MRKTLFIILIILNNIILNSEEFKRYVMEMVTTLPVGKENDVGKIEINLYDYTQGPTAMVFDNDGNLYISSALQDKLLKYNSNFKFEKEFKGCYSTYARRLFIDENGNFITVADTGIAVDDKNGNKLFGIDFYNTVYKDKFERDNFIYVNNTVYAFLKDGGIISIKNPGINQEENKKRIIGDKETRGNIINQKKILSNKIGSSDKEIKIDDKNRIIFDGKLLNKDYKKFIEYNKEKNNGKIKTSIINNNNFDIEKLQNCYYLGKDNNNNSYWGGHECVTIFDGNGQLLDYFIVDFNKVKTNPAIHPSGDVYFLNYDVNGVYLYRVRRVW